MNSIKLNLVSFFLSTIILLDGRMLYSLRSADVFPVGASLPSKINSDHAKSFNFFFRALTSTYDSILN